MPLQSSVRALKKPKPPRLDDEVRFLRSWIEKPLHMGAVMPSGRVLARTMAQYVDIDSSEPVVELGPGTGAIASAEPSCAARAAGLPECDLDHVRAENPRDPRLASHRLAQCEACGGGGL